MGPPPPSRPLSFLLPFPCHLRAIRESTTQTARIRGLAKPALGRHRVDPRRGPQSETRFPERDAVPRTRRGTRRSQAGCHDVRTAGQGRQGLPPWTGLDGPQRGAWLRGAAADGSGRGLATGHVLLLRQTAARWPGARCTPLELSPQARWQTDT